ncbi:Methylmalonate-semialdehyde dehydrogenase [acylating], mitochondrial [Orobanche gracilis]
MEAGLPSGILNIVHGTKDIVNDICDNDDITAVSFVGSNTIIRPQLESWTEQQFGSGNSLRHSC